MNMLLAIFIGGGTGAVARHFSVLAAARVFGETFPWGTLFVNVLGSFIIGVLMEGAALKWQIGPDMRALLGTGFLGGFTTFSAFSFDFFKLADTGHMMSAVGYAAASVSLSFVAVFGGIFLIRGVLG